MSLTLNRLRGVKTGLSGLIIAYDRHGPVETPNGYHLRGERLPEFLHGLLAAKMPLLERVAVVLGGDLYAVLDKRRVAFAMLGASGENLTTITIQ